MEDHFLGITLDLNNKYSFDWTSGRSSRSRLFLRAQMNSKNKIQNR